MSRGRLRRIALLLCGYLQWPAFAGAQSIQTQLQDSAGGGPLAGVVVQLVGPGGRLAAVGSSSQSGRVALGPVTAGSYRLRVLRIGFRPWTSDQIELTDGRTWTRPFRVGAEPLQLAEITVTTESPCAATPGADRRMALLWDEARTTLGFTGGSRDRLVFRTLLLRRFLGRDRSRLSEERSISEGRGAWPVLTQSPDSLALLGFVQPRDTVDGPVYFGPDPVVFFSDAFVAGHCFRLVPAPPGSGDLLGLGFEPLPGRRLPDVAGVLWFERNTGLKRLEYRYTGLWRWVPHDGAGGALEFDRLPGGRPIVTRWTIRAPIAARDRGRVARPGEGDTRRFFGAGVIVLHGFREDEGRVEAVRTPSGRELWRWEPPDSAAATPIPSRRAS